MKTKFTLTVDGNEKELTSDCIFNWDDIVCDYKRSEFGGVVRSFSSKFEFVNDAYEMLTDAYLRDGVRTSASVAMHVLNNDWSWTKEFEAALNFSTAQWDGHVFSVNCIDDGLAALIKSRKSTKYEFEVGEEIEVGGILNFDRVIMQNSCAHEIMGEENASNGAVMVKSAATSTRLPVYSLSGESFEGSPVLYEDQTTDVGSAFVSAVRQVSNLKMRIEIWSNTPGIWVCHPESLDIHLIKFSGKDLNNTDLGSVFSCEFQKIPYGTGLSAWGIADRRCVGTFRSLEELKRAFPKPDQNVWAKIAKSDSLDDVEDVYFTPVSNNPKYVKWEKGTPSRYGLRGWGKVGLVTCDYKKHIIEFEFPLVEEGAKFALFYTARIVNNNNTGPRVPLFPIFSKITTTWESRANAIDINAIRPSALASALMEKICDGKYNVIPRFSGHDPRLDKTYLLAAESVRGIDRAKIYSSFNDFCDWMETVFGYVYTLGEPRRPPYSGMMPVHEIRDDWSIDFGDSHGEVVDGYCPDGYYMEAPSFIRSHGCFCVFDTRETGNMYTKWKDSFKYNDESGKGRRDILFDSGSKYYAMDDDGDLAEFDGDAKAATRITQPVIFAHRGELFQNKEQGLTFGDAKEPKCKVNNSILYSTVEAGYEKQDYETECGRDEWNFMNYYNTGIDVIEKKLTLQSKYRADCYGLEFLAQERAKDSTDNKSDNTVFFVYTKLEETERESEGAGSSGDDEDTAIQEATTLKIDRSAKIQGALTDSVFNGEFSPYYCVKANEGYISAMAPNVILQFASSDGNSDIVIDGVNTTDDIQLSGRLFSESELEFEAPYLEQPADFSKLINVVTGGLVYSGFLRQTEYCFARPASVKYSLIVKSVKPV